MMAFNNFREVENQQVIRFDYSTSNEYRIIRFTFNGPQIEKYIVDDIQNVVESNQDRDKKLNLNFKIMRKIVSEIKGKLEIDSAPEKNIFTLHLPYDA